MADRSQTIFWFITVIAGLYLAVGGLPVIRATDVSLLASAEDTDVPAAAGHKHADGSSCGMGAGCGCGH